MQWRLYPQLYLWFYIQDVTLSSCCEIRYCCHIDFLHFVAWSYWLSGKKKSTLREGRRCQSRCVNAVNSRMRSKKERNVAQPVNAPLTPSSQLKIGEWFIVLRRAPSRDGVVNERCLATLVEIRSDEEAIQAASIENTSEKVPFQTLPSYFSIAMIQEFCAIRLGSPLKESCWLQIL